MGNQVLSSVENNFTKGLVTEFTGLNFPENAATDCDNVTFTIVGDVTRREGIDYELNSTTTNQSRAGRAMSSYKWNNVGGDGRTQIVVEQIGETLLFYRSDAVSIATPLSTQLLTSTVTLSGFVPVGSNFNATLECQYSDGNGYLFIYHPSCDPVYCTYNSGTITGNSIQIQVRDFAGVFESIGSNIRPTTLTPEHNYNLINQGWIAGNPWQGSDTTSTITVGLGSKVFTIAAGLPVTLGDSVTVIYNGNPASPGAPPVGTPLMSGTVTAYSGTSLTVNVNSGSSGYFGIAMVGFLINPRSTAYLSTWTAAAGNYPSNADVWWYYKDSTGAFNPSSTLSNVSLSVGNAPRGHFTLNAFDQQKSIISGVTGITPTTTLVRPKTGTWFQGRVWYTGVDAQQPATGDAVYYTWTESIYFSQIVNGISDFGHCYQVNDPTSENLFDLLPTDGGVIQIQGCGSIYKLFPIQNGMLVFAANGIWFITGSQGIGFSANDYTINKISSVQSISSSSFVNVQGLPYFWNEEGIYAVEPSKGGGLEVNPITVGTILSFYNNIPITSKKYVRGDYHPIDYVIQWVYRSNNSNDVTGNYEFDKILNFSTYNKAFYPYTVSTGTGLPTINGINYVSHPGGVNAPDPVFKYYTSTVQRGVYSLTFSEENDPSYTDWSASTSTDYTSYFITGYKLHGQGQRRFQIPYIYVFSKDETAYKIQGLWDYATSGNSGRWSVAQITNNSTLNFGMVFRRHKIRGQGLVLQLKVTSVSGEPFDIFGWSTYETQSTGV